MGRMSKDDITEFLIGDTQLGIELTTRDFVKSLEIDGDKHKLALAELAYRLARKLDRDAGMATAAIAKELRETLGQIADTSNVDDEFWKHFGSATPSVPPTIRNT